MRSLSDRDHHTTKETGVPVTPRCRTTRQNHHDVKGEPLFGERVRTGRNRAIATDPCERARRRTSRQNIRATSVEPRASSAHPRSSTVTGFELAPSLIK